MRLYVLVSLVLYVLSCTALLAMCVWDDDPCLALMMIEKEREYQLAKVKKLDLVSQSMSMLPQQVDPEELECILCFKAYNHKRVRIIVACDVEGGISHSFCDPCLTDWRKRSNTCPTCRRPLVLEQPAVQMSLVQFLFSMSCFANPEDE